MCQWYWWYNTRQFKIGLEKSINSKALKGQTTWLIRGPLLPTGCQRRPIMKMIMSEAPLGQSIPEKRGSRAFTYWAHNKVPTNGVHAQYWFAIQGIQHNTCELDMLLHSKKEVRIMARWINERDQSQPSIALYTIFSEELNCSRDTMKTGRPLSARSEVHD